MSKFKTQNSHTGFKPLDNQMNIHSLSSSIQGEDLQTIDTALAGFSTCEDKNALALAITKTCKLNSDLYPLEKLLRQVSYLDCLTKDLCIAVQYPLIYKITKVFTTHNCFNLKF
jgi:hypothetical protein